MITLHGTPLKDGNYEYKFKLHSFVGLKAVLSLIGVSILAFFLNGGLQKVEIYLLVGIILVSIPLWAINRFLLQVSEELTVNYKEIMKPNRLVGKYFMVPKERDRYLELTRNMYFSIEPEDKVHVTYGLLFGTVSELVLYKKEKIIKLSEDDMERKTKEGLKSTNRWFKIL